MTARRNELCTVSHHIAGDVHSRQMTHHNQRIAELEAEIDALKAINGWTPARETGRVLQELAAAFRIGEEAGWPTATSTPVDAEKVHTGKKSASQQPRGGNRAARQAVFVLQRKVEEAIDSFTTRRQNNWETFYRLNEIECEQCGGWFEAKRKDARFCSDACRVASHRVTADVTDREKIPTERGRA